MADGRIDALVLSGGGSRGAYQIGAALGMMEAGFRPELIVGTSVGAINGALLTSGLTAQEIRDIWLGLNRSDIALARRDIWRFWTWRSLLRHDPLRQLLERGVDFDAVRNSPIRFIVTAADLCCGEVQEWSNEELTVDHLLASAAIPGALPPVELDGHMYADGAVVNNTPLRPAVRAGADEVFILLTDPAEPHPSPRPKNVIDILARIGDIHTHQSLSRELIKGEEINELMAKGIKHADWKPIGFHVIAPKEPLGGRALDFDPATTRQRIQLGEQDGFAAMQQWSPKPIRRRRFFGRN